MRSMTYWQDVSPDFRARLDELAALFLACRSAFHETADTYRWEPAVGSPAAGDAAVLPSPDTAVPNPHGETGHRLIAEAVQIFLLSASGHMGGLASLHTSAEVLFSPPLLIRAVIENCAHAIWILGDDPDESAENRLARVYLEELKSAEEAKKNAGRLRSKADKTYLRTEAAYKELKTQILGRFSGASKEELGKWSLHGQQLPGLEAAVMWMYALTEKSGGTIDQDTASGIYGLLSNLTHPTLYPVREQRTWVHDAATGLSVSQLRKEADSIDRDARMVLAAFYNALNYVTSYFGWPTNILDELEVKIQEAIPGFFR